MATGNIDQQDPLLAFDNLDTGAEEDDSSAMSLLDHLEELRKRIFICLIAVLAGTIVAFIFRESILHFLEVPLPQHVNALAKDGKNLVVTGIGEGFTVFLMISVAAGVVLALPVILYEIWAFIAPGLYEREKKYAVPFIFIGIVLFALGISIGYFVLRYPVEWLVTFASGSFTELITANSYFTFVAFFVLAFGIVFEIPLVITFLAKIGIVSLDTLKKKRPAAHVGMWIAATFLTPGADLYSPIILGVCMSFLYEITIIFIRFAIKPDPTIT